MSDQATAHSSVHSLKSVPRPSEKRVPSSSPTASPNSIVGKDLASPQPVPFSAHFFDGSEAVARKAYLKALIGGCFLVIVAIFGVFSIYWGSLWRTPVTTFPGWVVDFDGGIVGQAVVRDLTTSAPPAVPSRIVWTAVPASQFPGGPQQVGNAVVEQHSWIAVSILSGSSKSLEACYISPNSTYNGSAVMTVYASEARNENAYRVILRPAVQSQLGSISQQFALQAIPALQSDNAINMTALLNTSPQTVLTPIGYIIDNLVPFDEPVATAVTFVGLIYQLILAFFVVMIAFGAREVSGLNMSLTLPSLITLRLVSSFLAYFIVSLFYALLSLAFKLSFTRKFGSSGFVIFWMLNWLGMLSTGLALEALITILTPKYIPFFMILWIIVNVSVAAYPIEVLPSIYRYGYAVPFYNLSHASRCIVFGAKNTVGMNFSILIIWTAISCVTLPLIQWFVRRKDVQEVQAKTQRSPRGLEATTDTHTLQPGRNI
ncbi:hypothetical protein BDZ94DRAFT_812758 [Collybia nuda]|uniref:DUF3533 domain-containing protein n=1 Tax=Collybia nuda TaxID=64659 RepID=A0A9P6CHZ6_9AGAR|nr:hypothetical protein BDZ94DRAFT_812758 [Collybia nuda]